MKLPRLVLPGEDGGAEGAAGKNLENAPGPKRLGVFSGIVHQTTGTAVDEVDKLQGRTVISNGAELLVFLILTDFFCVCFLKYER